MSTIHQAAAVGFAAKADSYVRGRPDYPPALDAWLRDELDLEPGKTVVDLGAGTGKFTLRLMTTGAAVIAIEPVAEMLQKLSERYPEITAKAGTAESIPLADASVDAVVCAQAFHWFATAAALTEIHRVLKPGGSLGLVWNTRDERIPWVAKLADIFAPYEGDTPRHYTGEWKKPFPFNGFSVLREHHFSNSHIGAPEDVIVNRVLSTSFIAALPPEKQEQVAAEVRSLIAHEPSLNGKTEVTLPYDTAAYSCVKD
ncbi:class I SAM-dependent methyltransferase [Phyllobacterium myrsinacearum]|uniref:SAM-dependent methyltransferase n=1 Tax=Phyllobacterium myrsinacearum TaxID=28101 RepID=A0A839EKS7_9HYPH|nr:class I SAM-dependent methyltransferase [Phyllobacterium myrsinacearum]MBA8877320.1 SAM-dependent methyltransferase [Phyllobacterium myrsinacearum]